MVPAKEAAVRRPFEAIHLVPKGIMDKAGHATQKADQETKKSMRAQLHYLTTAIIMPVYGIQVCPYIESLSAAQVAVPIVAAMALQFMVRHHVRNAWILGATLEKQTVRAFLLEMALFTITGLALSLYNNILYDFPLVSGLKVIVGIFALGFFAAIDLGLKQERIVGDIVEETGADLDANTESFPMTRRVAMFAAALVIMLISVFILLVIKDLDWIVEVGDTIPLLDARISIIKEFLFVLAVVLPHTLNIIYSYATNLKRFLGHENRVLTSISSGVLDVRVPVSSNDEFGVMAKHTNLMVGQIRDYIDEINLTRDVTILSLASLAEARDNETGAHILRTQRYVRALAEHLKGHPSYSEVLDEQTIDLLYKSAPLHDIGKVGIPDAILLKPGKHEPEEFEIMKTHAAIGAEALQGAEKKLGTTSFLGLAREIAETHHEKWDGSGYPAGLAGETIPLSGRLMAVADVYDALISKRVYKPAFPHEKAMAIIREGRGSHFDPDVVDALDTIEAEFQTIAAEFRDEGAE